MKKSKLVSLLLATLLAVTVCAAPVFADEAAELAAAKAALTAEVLTAATYEPAEFITQSLSLPSEFEGCSVSWQSDAPSVIAADGTVARPLLDTAVNLTATLTKGAASDTKVIPLVAKSAAVTVEKQDTFYDAAVTELPADKSVYRFMETTTAGMAKLAKDANNDYYTEVDFDTHSGAFGSTVYVNDQLTLNSSSPLYAYYKVKMAGASQNGIDLRLSIRNGSNGSKKTGITVARIKDVTDWTPLLVKIDLANRKASYKLGDGAWQQYSDFPTDYEYAAGDFVSDLLFSRAGSSTPENKLMISDAAVYTEGNISEVLAAEPAAERVAFFKSLITRESMTVEEPDEIANDLTPGAGYAAFDLNACGVSVSWESDNESAIAADGTVTAGLMPKTATLTATITAEDVTETLAFTFVVPTQDSKKLDAPYGYCDFEDDATVEKLGLALYGNYASYDLVKEATGTHGRVLRLQNTSVDQAAYVSTNGALYTIKMDKRYYISADIKYKRDNLEKAENAFGCFNVMGVGNQVACEVGFDFKTSSIRLSYSKPTENGSVASDYLVATYPMPEGVAENEWFRVFVDYNSISKTYQVYVNDTLINEIPLIKVHLENTGNAHPLRGLQLGLSKAGTIWMDNFSIRECKNQDNLKANAGINAALVTYASALHHDALTSVSFEKTGPSAYTQTTTDVFANPGLYDFSGGAALSYKIDGAAADSLTADSIGVKTLEITAVSGSKTETKTVMRRTAPISIDDMTVTGSTLTSVRLSGSVNGKKLMTAAYAADGKLHDVRIYDAATEVTADLAVPAGGSIRTFVFDSLTGLLPIAYSR